MGECIDATVMKIENPSATIKDLFKVFHGPDFPTGGFIIPVDSLEDIYSTGKGRIKIRSRLHIENDDNGKKNIVITEIPYQVSKAELLSRIADLKEANKDALQGIAEIVDESDKSGTRAVVKCKKTRTSTKSFPSSLRRAISKWAIPSIWLQSQTVSPNNCRLRRISTTTSNINAL